MTRILGVIGFALLLMGAGPYQNPYYQGEPEPPPQTRISPSLAWDLYTVMQADRHPRPDTYIAPVPNPTFDLNQLFPVPQTQIFRPWYLRPYPPSQVVTPGPRPRPLGICTHVGNRILCN